MSQKYVLNFQKFLYLFLQHTNTNVSVPRKFYPSHISVAAHFKHNVITYYIAFTLMHVCAELFRYINGIIF